MHPRLASGDWASLLTHTPNAPQLLCARDLSPMNRSSLPNPYAVLLAGSQRHRTAAHRYAGEGPQPLLCTLPSQAATGSCGSCGSWHVLTSSSTSM